MLGMRHVVNGFAREEKRPISVQHAIASEWSTLMSGGAGGFDTPLHILYDGLFYFPNRYPKRGSSADALSTRTATRVRVCSCVRACVFVHECLCVCACVCVCGYGVLCLCVRAQPSSGCACHLKAGPRRATPQKYAKNIGGPHHNRLTLDRKK